LRALFDAVGDLGDSLGAGLAVKDDAADDPSLCDLARGDDHARVA
jgi:hypothetical protein